MPINHIEQRMAKIRKLFPNDELLIAAAEKLFNRYDTENECKMAINVSNGAWAAFFNGKARNGVRLSIIFTVAKPAIEKYILPKR